MTFHFNLINDKAYHLENEKFDDNLMKKNAPYH